MKKKKNKKKKNCQFFGQRKSSNDNAKSEKTSLNYTQNTAKFESLLLQIVLYSPRPGALREVGVQRGGNKLW